MSTLSPFVYWGQTAKQITLKVDLKDVKDPQIDVDPSKIHFAGTGNGAQGLKAYTFEIQLFGKINHEDISCKILDSKIDITLKKCEESWWPRITSQPQKAQWLKLDFDRWNTEDDLLDDEYAGRNVSEDYPGSYEKLFKEEYGYRKEQNKIVYLIFYNLCQFIGFLYVVLVMSIRYSRDGPESIPGTYEAVGNALKFCQLLQYLEVLHPLFGYTKGGALIPFLQVSGRNFVLFIMIEAEERMQTKPVVFYLIIVWSLVETVRYPYYITGLLKKNIGLLTWIRYTIWIPLYPLGILCEGMVILRNIPYFVETGRYTVSLPNAWNFAFDMPLFMKIYLLLLVIPGSYFMMNYMYKARNKKLAVKKWKRN